MLAGAQTALTSSVVVTRGALVALGDLEGHFAGPTPLGSAIQTVVVGGLAAGAAFGIARAIA
jgi:hypothetical protein